MKLLKKLSDRVLPALFWLCIMLAFDSAAICILTLTSAAIHEVGHILFATVIRRGGVSLPRGELLGLKIDTGSLLSYKDEAIIALGGPLINLLIFVVALPYLHTSDYVMALGVINLFTAITNLLPMRGYDGERIIHSLILSRWTVEVADSVTDALTLGCSAILSVVSLLLLMLVGEGWWIFTFFFSVLLSEILRKHRSTKSEIL